MAGCPAERQRYGTAASQSLFPPPNCEFAAAASAKGEAQPGDISPSEQGAVTTFFGCGCDGSRGQGFWMSLADTESASFLPGG